MTLMITSFAFYNAIISCTVSLTTNFFTVSSRTGGGGFRTQHNQHEWLFNHEFFVACLTYTNIKICRENICIPFLNSKACLLCCCCGFLFSQIPIFKKILSWCHLRNFFCLQTLWFISLYTLFLVRFHVILLWKIKVICDWQAWA